MSQVSALDAEIEALERVLDRTLTQSITTC
jgi:hypothetical protein